MLFLMTENTGLQILCSTSEIPKDGSLEGYCARRVPAAKRIGKGIGRLYRAPGVSKVKENPVPGAFPLGFYRLRVLRSWATSAPPRNGIEE